MYSYTDFDRAFVRARVAQFRDQVARRLSGALGEEEFRPLRLLNGVYLQLHAYMLRVAIPYGTLDSAQMRALADIAERWDRGYGHFTTRQNIQFNWPRLVDVPDMLEALAEVNLHAIQTSGNTIRNVTADPFAGAAADEVEDPRPWAELLRQWFTDHPEFQYLPRKFKIALTGSPRDRAVTRAHDIGLQLRRGAGGALGFRVLVGGGLGRTPMPGKVLADFLPADDLLPHAEAIVSVCNLLGRRDNKYKARLKIAVQDIGIARLRKLVDERFALLEPAFDRAAARARLARIRHQFARPAPPPRPADGFESARRADPAFRAWCDTNLAAHRLEDHAIVTVSLKAPGATPGDATAAQMRLLADLAERYSHDELRISHEQNVILPHVHKADLAALHAELLGGGLATANIGLASDIVACPGMDYCALATARSIPVARAIARRLDALKIEHEIGPLRIRISGCINACGHHHLGDIGILGLERAGVETYQITLGGDGGEDFAIGTRAGPGFAHDRIVPAIERLIAAYLDLRASAEESFLQTFRRLGPAPFRAALYPEKDKTHAPADAA